MCARFTLRRRLNLIIQELEGLLPRHPGLFDWDPTPAFNICPTQTVAAVRPTADAGGRELVPLKWGLIPSWAKDPKIATSCINARSGDGRREAGLPVGVQAAAVPRLGRRLLRVDRGEGQEAAVAL